nr:unnamed protein product [Callosobruchus analis]
MPLEDNKKIPIPNIITEIEYAIKELPTDNKNEIRANCCDILTNHKKKQVVENGPIRDEKKMKYAATGCHFSSVMYSLALLPIVVEKVKFTCDVKCLVILNLNCDFLLGCDWLHEVYVIYVLGIRFNDGERDYAVDFEPESKGNEVYEGISWNEEPRANIVRVDKQHRHKYSSEEIRNIAETANADDNTKEQLCKLLHDYQEIFSECRGKIKPYTHDTEMIDEVEKAKTDFISPLVLVKRKSAQLAFV